MYRLNTKIRLTILCLCGFELYSHWVPLNYCFKLNLKSKLPIALSHEIISLLTCQVLRNNSTNIIHSPQTTVAHWITQPRTTRSKYKTRAVIKRRGPGISPGYYECGLQLLSYESRRKNNTTKRNPQLFYSLPTCCIYPAT